MGDIFAVLAIVLVSTVSANTNNISCELAEHHQCTRLTGCTYFESLIQKGTDALTIGSELRKLFCGFDGFDIMICCPHSNLNEATTQSSFSAIETQQFDILPQNDAGFANNDGIIFSSLSGPNSVSSQSNIRPTVSPISSHAPIQKPAALNINNVIDHFNDYSPFDTNFKPENSSHSSYSSTGFTFAPLLIISASMSSQHLQPINSINISSNPGISNPIHQSQPLDSIYQRPSSSTFSTDSVQSASSSNSIVITRPPNQCGISNYTHSRVVGGAITQLGQYPWIAALGYQFPNLSQFGGFQFYCGGTLVTRLHILTSAHCINPYLQVARLGEYDLARDDDASNPIDFAIAKTIVHERYEPDIILNDIAIVKLKRQVPVNDRIRPICLPLYEPLRSSDLTGYAPFVAGWGSISYQGPQSTILRETQVTIVPISKCKESYKAAFPHQVFDERIICAGDGGHDTCQGDSGGPLMTAQEFGDGRKGFFYILVGIVSYGYECARENYPGVYTRVSSFLPWIQENLS